MATGTGTGVDVFRVTPEGKYVHNNEEVSKETFDQRRAASSSAVKQLRGPDRSKMSQKDRAKAAFSDLETDETKAQEYRKGGAVKKRVAVKPSKTKVKAPVSVKPRSKTIKKR